jgi:hypothetical protein
MGESFSIQLFPTIIYLILIFVSVIMAVLGSIVLLTFFTSKSIRVKEQIVEKKNIGVALVLGSFIWTIGRMCFESIKPIMNSFYMNVASGFTLKTILFFIIEIFLSLLLALLMGAIIVYLSVKLLMVITKDIDEWEEIKQKNIAIAVIISVTVIVVGMFFEAIVSDIAMNISDLLK